MRVIRCPQCKHENVIKTGNAAWCALCGEDLMRCNYCRHLVAGDGCGKAEGADYYLLNDNGAKTCPHYSSIYQRRGMRIFQFIPAPVWVVVSIVFAFVLLIIATYSVDPDMRNFQGNEISADIKVMDNFEVGGDKAIYLHIFNPLKITSTDITVQMFGEFMTSAVMGKPEIINAPGVLPQKVLEDENGMTMQLYPLAPESEYTIKIPYHPLLSGEKMLHVQVFAPREVKVKDIDILIRE